jgi:ring-1,2-phenylacetyl-CoA epoxidase subunit PaaE
MSRFYPIRIAGLTRETRDAVVLTLDVPEEYRHNFQFFPGQHLTLRATLDGEEVRRSYSICSAPSDAALRIAIKRAQEGLFSTWANTHLQTGHTIDMMEPSGGFHVPLQPDSARHHLAFASGSGITPILSIMKATLEGEPQSRFTLVYGNRASSSVLFKEDLASLKDRYLDRVTLVYVLSREHQDIELFNGRIDHAKTCSLLEHWIDPADIDMCYICGPQAMMEQVSEALQEHGISRNNIRVELFNSTMTHKPRAVLVSASAENESRITVIQDGRQRSFAIERNKATILEGALALGIELPYSCKAGVCSTCRCKLTKGEVEMDANFVLEDYEVARGFILACQSYPLTRELVLDFDQEG